MAGIRETASRTVADVGFVRLDELTIEAPDGTTAVRYAVRLPGAVAVVPLDGEDVVLIEQYRAARGETLLEIPAGMLDVAGEDPVATAHRELEEEVGFRTQSLSHLIDLATTPGATNETVSVYVAEGLQPVPRRPGSLEEHHATVVRVPLTRALEMVRDGAIRDAKSVVGLLLAAAR